MYNLAKKTQGIFIYTHFCRRKKSVIRLPRMQHLNSNWRFQSNYKIFIFSRSAV